MPDFMRAYVPDELRASVIAAEPGSPIRFVASTQHVGRDGLVIEQEGWDLGNFRKNPVFLWAHDYGGGLGGSPRPPIGRVDKVFTEDGHLKADVLFDQGDEFAREVERKYRQGFLNAVSVGWDTKEISPSENGKPARVTKSELLDISAVPVPGDPNALKERQKRALADYGRELLSLVEPENDEHRDQSPPAHRGAIPPHSTAKADEGTAWDAGVQVGQAEGASQLRRMHAWVDGEGDPDAKSSYKLPHHTAEGDVVWRGVAAAMARLLQAGTQIPDGDRRGTFNHLARHYQQFGKTPPEFRTNADLDAYGPAEIRGLFLEGEPELFPDFFAWQEQRAGAVLSARNHADLEQAITLIQGVIQRAKKEEKAEPSDEERAAELLAVFDEKIAGAA